MVDLTQEEIELTRTAATITGLIRPGESLSESDMKYLGRRLRAIDRASILAQDILPVYRVAPRIGKGDALIRIVREVSPLTSQQLEKLCDGFEQAGDAGLQCELEKLGIEFEKGSVALRRKIPENLKCEITSRPAGWPKGEVMSNDAGVVSAAESTQFPLIRISIEEMAKMRRGARGTPTHIAFDGGGKCYVWPSSIGNLDDLPTPKARRFLVEEYLGIDECWGEIEVGDKRVVVAFIREVKPITPEQMEDARSKTMNQYSGGPYNMLWIRLMLRELGIEVESEDFKL